jgi:xanthine dehydrogenase YagS FAD-binding subunit
VRRFDYTSPRALDEAVGFLSRAEPANGGGDGAVALAGGTDLLTLMKADLIAPSHLVDIKRLAELDDRIEAGRDGLTIGALATLARLEEDPLVQTHYPALAEAAGLAATPQLRNMATIGGNVLQRPRCWYFRNPRVTCWLKGGDDCLARAGENQLHALFDVSPCVAVHPSDPAAALVALAATVRFRGARGEREMPVAEFFEPPTEERRTETGIQDDELIVSLRLPPHGGAQSTYRKAMDRKVWAFALVGVAAVIWRENDRVAEARLVLSGVAPVPWRAESAERVLSGAVLDEQVIERAAEAALDGATPLAKNGYKAPLAKALVRGALTDLTNDAG